MLSREQIQEARDALAAISAFAPSTIALCDQAEAAIDLQAACKALLPWAKKWVATLNRDSVGSLYPNIRNAELNRAQGALDKADAIGQPKHTPESPYK